MLLYPTVDDNLEQKYVIQGNVYHVNTVNLAVPFEQIRERLLAIVQVSDRISG